MFDEIRYELNGMEIDRSRYVGTSLIKSYATFSNEIVYSLHNAGFLNSSDIAKSLMTDDGYFNFCVPLTILLGFCEDYERVVINTCHELILIRARNNNNYIVGDPATEPTLEFKIQWRMSHVALNEVNKPTYESWKVNNI